MRRVKSRAFRRGRIEIIPMIDVMFFLLLTFMIASMSMQQLNSLPVKLPKGVAAPLDVKTSLVLSVTKEGGIFLDKTPVTLEALPTSLKETLNGRDRVVVSADDKAPHGLVVQAMLRARSAGVIHFLIAVKP